MCHLSDPHFQTYSSWVLHFILSHSLWLKFVAFSYLGTLFWVIFVKIWYSGWGKISPYSWVTLRVKFFSQGTYFASFPLEVGGIWVAPPSKFGPVPINQSFGKSINHSCNQSINQTTNWSTCSVTALSLVFNNSIHCFCFSFSIIPFTAFVSRFHDSIHHLSRWVALTLISWGTTLISSVQHWSSEANWMKMWVESTLFHLFLLYLFILSDKPWPIECPAC